MSVKNNLALIQALLDTLDQHDSKDAQLAYELGYLIGLLAKIANNDSFVYSALRAELERRRKTLAGTGTRART